MIVHNDLKFVSDSIIRPTNATAYTAGDVISEVTTNDHHTFLNCAYGASNTGLIRSAKLTLSANQGTKPDLELWLFNTDIAEVADNGAFAPTDAEMLTLVGIIAFPVASFKVGLSGAAGSGNVICESYVRIPFAANSVGTLFGQLVVRNAYTPANIADETYKIELAIERNAQ